MSAILPAVLARPASRDARIVLGLTALALVARVVFVLSVDRDSFGFGDPAFYHYAASSLANGDGYLDLGGEPSARWPPVFPFVIAPFYALFGSDPLTGELVNAVIGAACVPVIFLLVRHVFGRREALVAAGVLALFPGQILYTDLLLAETLFAFELLVFFLVLAVRPINWRTAALLGLVTGIAALTRGEGIFLPIVVFVVWWPAVSRAVLLRRIAIVGAAMVLTIAPWAVRNTIELDTFIPIANNSGATLWAGHNPDAFGGAMYATPDLITVPQTAEPGSPEAAIEEDRFLRDEALDFMVHNPLDELKLIPLKLIHLNRGDSRIVDIWLNQVSPGDAKPVEGNTRIGMNLVLDFAYYSLLALTILAVILFGRAGWRQPVLRGILTLGIVALVLYGFVFYGNPRYRAPLEPLMIVLVAPLLTRLWDARGRLLPA
jgi:4-amino-4-deoxy-L-arabinose transferase-like glycosyltransferase